MASSILNSDDGLVSGTSGLKSTGGDDGVTIFQQNGTERMRIDSSGKVGIGQTNPSQLLVVGASNPVSNANITAIRSTANLGNCYEWGHSNPAGYRSTLGAYASGGQPFIGFSCEAGTNSNTFRTRGIAGSILSTDNAGALVFARATNANADNQTPTESMRIDASGNLLVGKTSATANGGDVQVSSGITFPATQVAKSDSNTLDDYEEGTWTPVLNSFGGTGLTATGQYSKIGRVVMLTFQVSGTNLATTLGSSYVSNLPFIGAQSNAGGASWASSNTGVSFENTLIVTNAVYAPTQAATGSTLSFVATYNV
jgi:hypothetical protein